VVQRIGVENASTFTAGVGDECLPWWQKGEGGVFRNQGVGWDIQRGKVSHGADFSQGGECAKERAYARTRCVGGRPGGLISWETLGASIESIFELRRFPHQHERARVLGKGGKK